MCKWVCDCIAHLLFCFHSHTNVHFIFEHCRPYNSLKQRYFVFCINTHWMSYTFEVVQDFIVRSVCCTHLSQQKRKTNKTNKTKPRKQKNQQNDFIGIWLRVGTSRWISYVDYWNQLWPSFWKFLLSLSLFFDTINWQP